MNVRLLPLAAIQPDPDQPRKFFNKEELENLANNIAEHGVLQPIIVRAGATKDSYIIVVGERRWRASTIAGRDTIPALVRNDMDGSALEESAISENTARMDLNAVEEARAFEKLRIRIFAEGLWTKEQAVANVARKVGKSKSYVDGRLSILTLDPDIIGLVETGQMFPNTAIMIARLPRTHQHLGLRALAEGINDNALKVFVEDILNRMNEVVMFDPQEVAERARDAVVLRDRVEKAIDQSIKAVYSLVDKKSRELLPAAFGNDFEPIIEKLLILEREVRNVRLQMAAAKAGSVVSDEELAKLGAGDEETLTLATSEKKSDVKRRLKTVGVEVSEIPA